MADVDVDAFDLAAHLAAVDAADSDSADPVERIRAQVAASRRRHRERGDLDVDTYTNLLPPKM